MRHATSFNNTRRGHCHHAETRQAIGGVPWSYYILMFVVTTSESCILWVAKVHSSTPWLATLPVTDSIPIATTRAQGHRTHLDKLSRSYTRTIDIPTQSNLTALPTTHVRRSLSHCNTRANRSSYRGLGNSTKNASQLSVSSQQ